MGDYFLEELHEICISKKINFGKYVNITEYVSIDFSVNRVKGHQKYWHAEEKYLFYGEDL